MAKIQTYLKKVLFVALVSVLLTGLLPMPAHAAFPGLNGRIVFQSDRDGDNEIYTVAQNGSGLMKLTDNNANDRQTIWSPDGAKILFTSDRDGDNDVFVMNADGSNQINLTDHAANDQQASWSPDGSKIAYSTDRDGNREIWVMDTDGSNPQAVTTTASGSNGNPSWSPDGTQLVYNTNSAPSTAQDIFTININGTNRINLTNLAGNQTSPNWFPGSSRIIYEDVADGDDELWIMDSDGNNKVKLTDNAVSDSQGRWFPDAGKVAFISQQDGNSEIYAMNPDGTNQVRLLADPAAENQAAIQPLTIHPATVTANPTLTYDGSPLIYDVLANHTDVYEEIDPASVTVTIQPTKGTTTVDSATGKITYTKITQTAGLWSRLASLFFPKVSAQSVGQDSFTYQVCSTVNSQMCTTNTVNINLPLLAETGTDPLITQSIGLGLITLALGLLIGKRVVYR